jgi:hypothetical protein
LSSRYFSSQTHFAATLKFDDSTVTFLHCGMLKSSREILPQFRTRAEIMAKHIQQRAPSCGVDMIAPGAQDGFVRVQEPVYDLFDMPAAGSPPARNRSNARRGDAS